MRRLGWSALILAAVGLAAAVVVLAISGGGGTEERGPGASGPHPRPPPHPTLNRGRGLGQDTPMTSAVRSTARLRESPAPRLDPGQRQVARVVRAYVAALDARDGAPRLPAVRPGRAVGGPVPPRSRHAAGARSRRRSDTATRAAFPSIEGSRVARIAGGRRSTGSAPGSSRPR